MIQRILRYFSCIFLFLVLTVTAPAGSGGASDVEAPSAGAPVDYVIVVTGGELLRGVYADTHTFYLTRTLGPLGCRCVRVMFVGDEQEALMDCLAQATKLADLIIVTGGLGPTDDDITRETLSTYTGIPLREHPDVVQAMVRRFRVSTRDELRANLLRQTLTPESGTYLPNPNGTAVGLVFDDGDQVIVALPGPPREMQPMVVDHLVPYLAKRFGIHSVGCSLTMRFVGIGESRIDQVMHRYVQLPSDVMVSSLFEFGRVDLTLSLPGDSPSDFARLKAIENQLSKYIGEYMYSDDGSSLEDHVIRLLTQRNASLVTAEVGSGGAVAASLNQAEGASRVYSGGYIAPNNRMMGKMLGLAVDSLSSASDTVAAMAQQACRNAGSRWGLAVGEVLEPDGESRYIWVGLGSLQKGIEVYSVPLRGHGETGRARLVNRCLDLLRRCLKQAPAEE